MSSSETYSLPPVSEKNALELEIPVTNEIPTKDDITKAEDDDPYKLPDLPDNNEKWKDMSTRERIKWFITSFGKTIGLLALLYTFVCTLDFLSSAFRLLGGKAVGEALSSSVLASNPIAGLMIGVLSTVLVQSSSTSTTIVVSMISADIITVKLAIPIIMGANIGTTVTNYIVAMGQTGDRNHFRRSYAAATVHDMFNWLNVLLLLPIEVATGYLFRLSQAIIDSLPHSNGTVNEPDFLKAITKPFTSFIVSIDSGVIAKIAQGKDENVTTMMKGGVVKDIGWNDTNTGILLLVLSLVVLCICLVLIVKLLHSVLSGKIAKIIRRIVNANSKGCLGFLTGLLAILIGAGLTFLVQSSSIFTSACTPLVGLGIIHIDRMYPMTLGANIGTTGTSLLAAFASAGSGNFDNSLQIALCHLFFNLTGVFAFYIIYPMRKLPIGAAKYMGNVTANYRWFALVYLISMYFLFPGIVFGLSLAGWRVLLGIGVPVIILILFIIIINIIQWKAPGILPKKLRTWDFLPAALHSLEPYDAIFISIKDKLPCKNKNVDSSYDQDDQPPVYVKTIS
ncbi:sodium-dependent phosphate transport protein 2B-like [Mytilus californianus]|uniref:sodium-dependent phosphate transport protein 2B-like n=1 Tax=Mytilus californianus TaxID=6549 RepID=UPI0022472955|nr:sodium-dependent phosphate transport protein 2B-like [Mytilus californianus]